MQEVVHGLQVCSSVLHAARPVCVEGMTLYCVSSVLVGILQSVAATMLKKQNLHRQPDSLRASSSCLSPFEPARVVKPTKLAYDPCHRKAGS